MYNTFATTGTSNLQALDIDFSKPINEVAEPAGTPLINPSIDNILDNVTGKGTDTTEVVETPAIANAVNLDVLDGAITELAPADTTEHVNTDITETAGRPKAVKDTMISYLVNKVEANDFGVPADYDTKIPLNEYLGKLPEKDLFNILDSNWQQKEQELRSTAPQEFYDALPEPAKIVAEYAAKGGTDWDNLFASLAQTRQIVQLDPTIEEHQEPLIKTYLQATTQMTPTQINEQVEDWKDSGKLERKALEFKAPLDLLQKQQNDQYLKQAEQVRLQEQERAQFYTNQVYETIKGNELAGIKLDKKWAQELAYNMTTVAPSPWSGQPVNYLGYGLDKCQYVEPNYNAVMVAAWILNDYDNAMNALSQRGANKGTEEAVKLIKLNQGISTGNTAVVTEPVKTVKRLPDQSRVFKRTS